MLKKSKFGFTLIELLVVISIIGILAALALVSYTGAQKQARDTQRRSDLGQYRNALENYAGANNGLYPIISTDWVTDAGICPSPLTTAFIASCPHDPLTTQSYWYQNNTLGTKYLLGVDLETAGYLYICSTGKISTEAVAQSAAGIVESFCP